MFEGRDFKRPAVRRACARSWSECHTGFALKEPYRDPGTDYEDLLVNRNASRWLRQLGRFGVVQMDREGALRVNCDALRPQAAKRRQPWKPATPSTEPTVLRQG